MKKILLIALMAFVGVGAYAQGTVNFSTIGATVQPSAIRKVDGSPAAGFTAALYWSGVGITDPSMFMQAGATASILSTGGVFGGTRTVPVDRAVSGGNANFQIRAWDNAFGSFDEAVSGGGEWGMSAIFESATASTVGTPPPTPSSLVAAANAAGVAMGFQLQVVPEPSVIALGLLGAGALLVLRRRK